MIVKMPSETLFSLPLQEIKKKKKKVYTVTSLNADMGLFKEKQKETH